MEGGHQPLWPETYARMPPEVQRLMPGVHARERDHRYEWQLVERPPLPAAGAEEGYAGAGAAEPLSDDEISAAVEHLSTFGKRHHLRKVLYRSAIGRPMIVSLGCVFTPTALRPQATPCWRGASCGSWRWRWRRRSSLTTRPTPRRTCTARATRTRRCSGC